MRNNAMLGGPDGLMATIERGMVVREVEAPVQARGTPFERFGKVEVDLQPRVEAPSDH